MPTILMSSSASLKRIILMFQATQTLAANPAWPLRRRA
jgi:hypothetical protein